MIKININNKEICADEGETILLAALRAGIKIPTLCFMRNSVSGGVCGLCTVHLKNSNNDVKACRTIVEEGMDIITDSAELFKLRQSVLKNAASNHRFDCEYCQQYSDCEFFLLLIEYGIEDYAYSHIANQVKTEKIFGKLFYDETKCLGCGRCVSACKENIFKITKGKASLISKNHCTGCGKCFSFCPAGAVITEEEDSIRAVRKILDFKKKPCTAVITSELCAIFGEFLYDPVGKECSGKLTAILKKVGFSSVVLVMAGKNGKESNQIVQEIAAKNNEKEMQTVLFTTRVEELSSGYPPIVSAYGLYTLLRRACVSRTTLQQVWRTLKEEKPVLINASMEMGTPMLHGLVPHRNYIKRNLEDIGMLRQNALEDVYKHNINKQEIEK